MRGRAVDPPLRRKNTR
ncbi:uncharacterized, partial [Tachysurus ichikawai]